MKKIFKIIIVIIVIAFIYNLGKTASSDEPIENKEDVVEVTPSEDTTQVETKEDEEDKYEIDINDNLVTPEFKEMMDSYEAFFDEYIDFMNNYDENDLNLLTDYLGYLDSFATTMDKMAAIDENELTEADTLYYLEVTTRIYNKLAEASY